jgi:hypothetical protein
LHKTRAIVNQKRKKREMNQNQIQKSYKGYLERPQIRIFFCTNSKHISRVWRFFKSIDAKHESRWRKRNLVFIFLSGRTSMEGCEYGKIGRWRRTRVWNGNGGEGLKWRWSERIPSVKTQNPKTKFSLHCLYFTLLIYY